MSEYGYYTNVLIEDLNHGVAGVKKRVTHYEQTLAQSCGSELACRATNEFWLDILSANGQAKVDVICHFGQQMSF